MSVSQRYRLHEVDSLCVDLDEGEDVSGFHCVTQRVEPRRRVGTLLSCKTFLCVFGSDEVFPRLPVGMMKKQLLNYSCINCALNVNGYGYASVVGLTGWQKL